MYVTVPCVCVSLIFVQTMGGDSLGELQLGHTALPGCALLLQALLSLPGLFRPGSKLGWINVA